MRLTMLRMGSAALALLAISATAAEAGSRVKFHWWPFGFGDYAYDEEYELVPEPYQRRRRPLRDLERYDDEDEWTVLESEDDYDEPPRRKRLDRMRDDLKKRAVKERKPAIKKKKAVAAVAPPVVKPKPQVKPKQKPQAKLMSCAKAGSIITGYGFGGVKPTDCNGEVYGFKASRSGKDYAIKLSSISGELTEVVRQ